MSELNTNDLTVLTAHEAAELLKVSEQWLKQNRLKPDGIPYYRIGRKVFYEKKDIIAWIKANKKKVVLSKKNDSNEGAL